MLHKHYWLAIGVVTLIGLHQLAGASEPSEMPRPSDFAMVEVVTPRHGEVGKAGPRAIRVRVSQTGGPVPAGLKLHVALDGRRLDREGRVSKAPILLSSGESDLTIPVVVNDSGVHSIEAYLVDYVPFSNKLTVKFGINPMLKADQ